MPDNASRTTDDTGAEGRDSVETFSSGGYRDTSPPDNNLPFQLTSLVGRRREISEVKRLLAEKTRLLTLTGPGGCGKTRLGLAVASDVVEEYEDGVWLVELASLADQALVPQAIASVLGVREQPGRPLTETIAEYLKNRKLLLVLDNCEHLIEACADFARALLRACPNLTILATSREALGLTGEVAWPTPPLSLPDPRHLPAVESLPQYEAALLFIERAAAVKAPGFELTPQNATAVAQVCYRLDGIPLAIELAAARAKVLSVEQISERLDESFRLLSGGSREAMAHHRTLEATMEWSYELLSQEEQVLFRRLSVFAGGFTLEAAEAVCAGEGLEEHEVLDVLCHLVDKSLVVAQRGGETRYRLLETIRQYGREKLAGFREEDVVRRRHADFFLELAEEAEPALRGRRQVAWLERLEMEHDNLRAAMRFLLDEGEIETAVRLAWALWLFWWYHGHHREGGRFVDEILEKGDALPIDLRAKAVWARGIMSYGLESIERMKKLFEESAALFRQAGDDKSGLALALSGMGIAALQRGDMEAATALFEEAMKFFRDVGNKWGVSNVLVNLGMVSLGGGDHERAVRYFEEAQAISREIGDRLSGYISLYNLALASRVLGEDERAAQLYAEGLGLAVEVSDKANAAYCIEGLAGLIAERGDAERAARLFGASEALLEAVGAPLYAQVQDRASVERAVEALHSTLGEEAFGVAWAEGRQMSPEEAVEYALQQATTPEEQRASPPTSYPAGLSAREVEVLRLVAKGMTNAEVARGLFVSPRTVSWHLGSIYRKLGLSSRAEATRFALEHNLL